MVAMVTELKSKITTGKAVIGSLLLLFFLSCYWGWLGYNQFIHSPLSQGEKNLIIQVNKGDTISALTRRWYRDGLIKHQYYLKIYTYFHPELTHIKAGEYQLNQQDTPASLLQKLAQGRVIQYTFTVIEGMNSYDVIRAINANPLLINDLELAPDKLSERLGIDPQFVSQSAALAQRLEGWLFPDSYFHPKNESAVKLLKRAVTKMQWVLTQEWQQRAQDLPYKTPFEALIMASIIEKESGIASERAKIAGVFVRRLKAKMPLGTDPTVIYGIGPQFNGDLTFKDLRTKTPYNTRIIKGLPPTPISMPSQASIHAALHPDHSTALYFVADGSGGHVFSDTLAEHNKAVQRYLKYLIQKKKAGP